MAEFRLCVIFIIIVGVHSDVLTGKAFYCRDPDTGKLHAVNSSWPSKSFCGVYTCKVRNKILEDVSLPIRQLNVSNIKLFNKTKQFPSIPNKMVPGFRSAENSDDIAESPMNERLSEIDDAKIKTDNKKDNGDRYLTEKEIRAITDILHTVKKSDLDAIIDIYNIAQDIYKEIDHVDTENVGGETKNDKGNNLMNRIKSIESNLVDNKHTSYWYEPLHANNNRGKPVDMETQGSNTITKTVPKNAESYFNGPLTNKDFGKIPYYYPMSNFQRMSSYVNPQTYIPPANFQPCRNAAINYGNYYGALKKSFPAESPKMIAPSVLLPYPFTYVHRYNITEYPSHLYYDRNLWTHFNFYKNPHMPPYPIHRDYVPPVEANLEGTRNAEPETNNENTQKALKEINILDSLISKVKGEKTSNWQTPPLAPHVIDEVKANILEKSKILKAFPLRKKVKIDKVGKVIKLDDFMRSKRQVEHNEDNTTEEQFEAYLEKTTCHSDTQPGFFRVGNLSEPFPNCCPQRIEKINNFTVVTPRP